MGIGADDYITKPFRIQELRARVAAHLRREKREHHSALAFEPDMRFDLSAKVLYVSEQPVPLSIGRRIILGTKRDLRAGNVIPLAPMIFHSGTYL